MFITIINSTPELNNFQFERAANERKRENRKKQRIETSVLAV